ncbi:ribonucleoside-diphosphate reductase, adenosylcobalamin-dependent [Rhodoferax lacus]|uniref:Ribonucleoside-diphosphate reductase, adenosylcobalamin-dependent n=1 Tax=Rhodoferax lacus TaxID=2184758 RepID=A0A3E1RBK4_9BURK|nr:ribonucleoside-diphosphate reductase, adenosylcobalamin-dependent [Rhodoferax lacus]RFO96050.1 ribonucleoside-diphosphate reductase, adenosylcobalamin-dependent [Rhodoferax lacus]
MADFLRDTRLQGGLSGQAKAQVPEASLGALWDRVALAVSAAEPQQPDVWRQRFRGILEGHRFQPGRQILHAAGVQPHACFSSCFAIAPLANSLEGVFDALHDSMVCLHAGADVGVDFSNVLPSHWEGFAHASAHMGPGPFANLWSVARGMLGRGNGHSATVALSLRCDHPDIESFVEALPARSADLQVQAVVVVLDAFMQAVQAGADWPLVFPLHGRALPPGAQVCERVWPGQAEPQPCLVHRHIKAQSLWVRLLQAQRTFASPRLLFVDTMQRCNNLWYAEHIYAANPGGSVALSVDAGCTTGSINLTRFVHDSSAEHPQMDWDQLRAVSAIAVRFLDDAHTLSSFPHRRLERNAHSTRRIGLGITGLDSLFAMLGLAYGSPSSLELTEQILRTVRDAAWQMSAELAQEKGAFPAFDATRHAAGAVVLDLPHALQDAIALHGVRNSQLLAVGVDGRVDPLADPVSHGIEPSAGAASAALSAEQQLELAARVQACVDNGVAVNIHVPSATPAIAFDAILQRAWALRLKNCLVQRAH